MLRIHLENHKNKVNAWVGIPERFLLLYVVHVASTEL